MCSHFLSSADAIVSRALVSDDDTFRYNTLFTAGVLPRLERPEQALGKEEAAVFLNHLFDGMLRKARSQGSCGSCWAYSLTGCLQYALRRSYQALGFYMYDQYMAHQYLLSCMQVENAACGCWGGNLPQAFEAVAERGAVTFLQFPYENDESVSTGEGQVHFLCKTNVDAGGYLGTCGPCAADEPSLESLVATPARGDKAPEGFSIVATCMPCQCVGGPFYHPTRPFTLYDPARSLQENVDATKAALRRFGPLSTALRINQKEFAELGEPKLLSDLAEAAVYRPQRSPASGSLHAVLVVGYFDPWARSGDAEDRARAVFVCRNSWGEDWGFKVRTREIVVDHQALSLADRTLGGLFCVAMYDAYEATGLLEHAIGVEGVQVRGTRDEPLRAVSEHDPFLIKFPLEVLRQLDSFYLASDGSLEASWSGRLARASADVALPAQLPWLAALALLLVLLIVAVAAW